MADRIAKIEACPDQAALEGFLVEDIQDLPVPYFYLKIWQVTARSPHQLVAYVVTWMKLLCTS